MNHNLEQPQIALGCEFAVASLLFFKGYYAGVTLKNYPKYDIFVSNPRTGKSVGINVKGRSIDQIDLPDADDGVTKVYVDARDTKSLRFYVVPSKDEPVLKKKSFEDYKKDHPKATFAFAAFEDLKDYEDRWDYLGLD